MKGLGKSDYHSILYMYITVYYTVSISYNNNYVTILRLIFQVFYVILELEPSLLW